MYSDSFRSIRTGIRSLSYLLSGLLLLAGVGCSGTSSEGEGASQDQRPNVLIILADDLGYSDISPYGSEIETPHLQTLAEGGMRFTQMTNTSKCFPSRAELLTGVYAQQADMHDDPGRFHNSVMLGEVLKRAGYRTLFVGKHHGMDNPYRWGFDHYWGLRDGAANYFNPGEQRPSDPGPPAQKDWAYPRTFVFDDSVAAPFTPDTIYYGTDTWTDWSLELLRRYEDEDRPFFLYLSYQAPHDPLQAPEEAIEEYEGRYDEGYAAIRNARYERQIESGLIDPERYPLSEATHRNWEDLTPAEREDQARRMEVYAAMIDRMDQNIGRLIDYLKARGEFENTLIFFASDNGASSEVVQIGDGPIGSVHRWASLKEDWANVGNTPFRYYKNYTYQGGVATPFIAHWPGSIEAGTQTPVMARFTDIMPTLVELTGAEYPDTYKGEEVVEMQGRSLMPVLRGSSIEREGPIYWKWADSRAIWANGWKLVDHGEMGWRLFDLSGDRTETQNLRAEHPDRVDSLRSAWENWYEGTAPFRTDTTDSD